jgi:deoxycytidine triphosphate deaminase
MRNSPATIWKEGQMGNTGYLLQPGAVLLTRTRETLRLPQNVACMLSVRRSCANIGLDFLQSDFFCEPQTDNQLTLMTKNVGPWPVTIYPGMLCVKGIFLKQQ